MVNRPNNPKVSSDVSYVEYHWRWEWWLALTAACWFYFHSTAYVSQQSAGRAIVSGLLYRIALHLEPLIRCGADTFTEKCRGGVITPPSV